MRCLSPPVSIKHSLCRHSWSCLTFSHSLELLSMDIFGGFLDVEAFDSSEVPDGKAQLLPPWVSHTYYVCKWRVLLPLTSKIPHSIRLYMFASATCLEPFCLPVQHAPLKQSHQNIALLSERWLIFSPFLKRRKVQFPDRSRVPPRPQHPLWTAPGLSTGLAPRRPPCTFALHCRWRSWPWLTLEPCPPPLPAARHLPGSAGMM